MYRIRPKSLLALLVFALILPEKAESHELSRPALMGVARDFLDRIGKKLQAPVTEASPVNNIPENDLLIFQPRIGEKIMVDAAIGGIRKDKTLFISFREFCQGMNFPLMVDTERLVAQGWFLKEDHTFTMDLNQGFVQSIGKRFEVSENEWFRQDGEIFVSSDSIRLWMGIDSVVDTEELLLDLVSDTPFPLENKLERRKRKLETVEFQKTPIQPRVDNPYRTASVPAADISLNNSVNKKHHELAESKVTQTIQTAGDLFGQTVRSFTTINRDHGLESFRFTAGQKSDQTDLLGSLHAREYQFGDVVPTELAGTGGSDQSFGARITNAEEGEITGSTSRAFEGDIPPDWDVELYDGPQLIAFQTVGPEGRYKFSDIDLFAGENDFRLVFYGPQGEIREEEVSIPVSLETVGADKKLYDISLTLNHVNTYSYYPDDNVDKGTPHLVVSYEQGIKEGLTLNAGLRARQANEKWKALAKTGVVVRAGKALLNANLVTDEELESSFQLIARQNFGEHSLRSSSLFATSKFDPDNGGGEVTTYRGEFSARGPLFHIRKSEISYGLETRYSELARGGNNMSAQFAQSTRVGKYTIGHALDFNRVYNEDGQTQEIASVFSARSSIGQTRIRGSARYIYYPDRELDNLTLNISRYLHKNVQAELEIKHDIKPDSTEATAKLNWQNDYFVLSPNITYNTDHDMRAGVNMRFGLVYDDFNKSVTMTRGSTTGKGAVHAFVYLDKDGNRKFDGADEPIPDAKVMGVQIPRNEMTDKDGVAFIHDLPEYEATDIILDQSTLGDPYYVSGSNGMSVLPRPGAPVNIEFPVHMSGEMDGTVYKPGVRGTEAASGVRLQLFNTSGESVMSSLTAFDGYYVISVIPPGDYLLMIDPDDLYNSGYRQPWPHKITIGYDGKVLAGQNIFLERGTEVPILFYKAPKENSVKKLALAPNSIELKMGSYKSYLLTQVMKLRIQKALRESGIEPVPLSLRETQIKDKPAQEVVTTLPTSALEEARNICAALTEKRLTCAITLPPQVLLNDNASADQSTIAKKPEG